MRLLFVDDCVDHRIAHPMSKRTKRAYLLAVTGRLEEALLEEAAAFAEAPLGRMM